MPIRAAVTAAAMPAGVPPTTSTGTVAVHEEPSAVLPRIAGATAGGSAVRAAAKMAAVRKRRRLCAVPVTWLVLRGIAKLALAAGKTTLLPNPPILLQQLSAKTPLILTHNGRGVSEEIHGQQETHFD